MCVTCCTRCGRKQIWRLCVAPAFNVRSAFTKQNGPSVARQDACSCIIKDSFQYHLINNQQKTEPSIWIAIKDKNMQPARQNHYQLLAQNVLTKARFPLPELTAGVNGPSWRVTGFITRQVVNTGSVDGRAVSTSWVDGPSTQLVETGLKRDDTHSVKVTKQRTQQKITISSWHSMHGNKRRIQ